MADTTAKVNGTSNAHGSTEGPTPLENLLAVAVIVLHQAIDLLEDKISSDDQLSYRSKYIPGSTIGESRRDPSDLRSGLKTLSLHDRKTPAARERSLCAPR